MLHFPLLICLPRAAAEIHDLVRREEAALAHGGGQRQTRDSVAVFGWRDICVCAATASGAASNQQCGE